MTESEPVAYSGSPTQFASGNTFEWLFSQPFKNESAFAPAGQVVPPIREDQAIYVDHANGRRLTYSQLRNDALAFASGLRSLGLDPAKVTELPATPTCAAPEVAPVVLIQLPNCLAFAPILLGTISAGLTATLASPALTATEVAWILQNSRPQCIITTVNHLKTMKEAISMQPDPAHYARTPTFTVDFSHDTYPVAAQSPFVNSWTSLLFSTRKQTPPPPFNPRNRTAVILWSSGTSGRSKGVLLSHHALNFSIASLWHDADFYLGRPQRWTGYVPFYHVFGLCNVLLPAVAVGARIYVMQAFKLDVLLEAVASRKITYLHMAPPVAVMLAKSPAVEAYAKRDERGVNRFGSVVAAVTGGAPLGDEVVAQVYSRLGFRIRRGYGLTETCSVSLQAGISELDMLAQQNDTGSPHWGVELMIAADADPSAADGTTKPVAAGSPGEVLVRSPCLLSAYLPAPTDGASTPDMSITQAALTADGWFRTGDVGIIDPRGSLHITDRIKELIKVQAYQVAPAELEAVLCGCDEVADAGVVAVQDTANATEWPRAYVVPSAGSRAAACVAELGDASGGAAAAARGDVAAAEEVLGALAARLGKHVEGHTARYKWLRGGIVFVPQIPKSPSGKILRRVMRDGGVKGYTVALYEPKVRETKL